MKTNLKIITPIVTKDRSLLKEIKKYRRDDLDIDHVAIEQGPASIENSFDDALCALNLLKQAAQAEQSGYTIPGY